MAGPDNRTLIVGWAKIILPLCALALLSTLFLFARRSEDDRIPLTEIAAMAREPRIGNPTFAGVADDGSVVALRAEEIRPVPDRTDSLAVSGVRLAVTAVDGSEIELRAGAGEIDALGRTAAFTDLVSLTSSAGYAIETTGARADLRSGTVETEGPLAVQTPFGRLDAGKLVITADPGGAGTQLLFQNGVRLLYVPQT